MTKRRFSDDKKMMVSLMLIFRGTSHGILARNKKARNFINHYSTLLLSLSSSFHPLFVRPAMGMNTIVFAYLPLSIRFRANRRTPLIPINDFIRASVSTPEKKAKQIINQLLLFF